jgi:hypothetical protein
MWDYLMGSEKLTIPYYVHAACRRRGIIGLFSKLMPRYILLRLIFMPIFIYYVEKRSWEPYEFRGNGNQKNIALYKTWKSIYFITSASADERNGCSNDWNRSYEENYLKKDRNVISQFEFLMGNGTPIYSFRCLTWLGIFSFEPQAWC